MFIADAAGANLSAPCPATDVRALGRYQPFHGVNRRLIEEDLAAGRAGLHCGMFIIDYAVKKYDSMNFYCWMLHTTHREAKELHS